ncbi:MAG TPA: VWA domain-containing protein [Polyangiaceae bacterium]|nr:VWA domain-containing protein [Polyangiaceae bacterium]
MTFVGLSAAALGATFAAAGAATVALYILKLRRRPVAVPFSPIWQRVLRDKDASQLFSRLKNLLSLLLQLVLLGLIVFALGDPRPAAGAAEGRSIVVLVDTSASMQAIDVRPTRLDVAKQKVNELVQGLGIADRMLIAKMDASTVPLSTMTSEQVELSDALGKVVATDTRADLASGLAFSLDVLRGAKRPEIIVVSDGALDAETAARGLELGSVPVRLVPVGKGGKNVAITAFSVRRYPLDVSRYEVLLEVTNTTDAPAEVELSLLGDGNVVDVSRLSLKPNERLPRVYADLGGASKMLEARIRLADGTEDSLPADDRAYALMPERRRARVQVVSRGNTYLDAALLLDEYLDVTSTKPEAYRADAPFDVTIFDGVAPPAPSSGGALYLAPPEQGSPVKVGKAVSEFGFDTWDRKSPLLRFMAVDNVQISRGHVFVPEKTDRVVGASEFGPTLVSGRRDGHPFVALGFDPRDSDLVLRVAWPLFVLNVIHSFVEDDASYLSAYRTGTPWRVPAPSDASVAWVRYPNGESHEVPIKEGRAVLFGEHAGFYELRPGTPTAPASYFAANLSDDAESHVTPKTELQLPGAKSAPDAGFHAGVRRELWVYFVMAALALSALEWFSYHRRVTV